MPRGRPNSAADEAEKRERILDAAMQCFVQLGMEKTSLTDVARVAELSRGTVYRYFTDRKTLVNAVVESGSQKYFSDAAAAMRSKSTLAKQVGAFAASAAETAVSHNSPARLLNGDTALMRLIVADSDESLRRTVAFLRPYVEAAKERGEIAKSTKVDEACEWLGRMVMSISSVPSSPTFDISNPRSVASFVERFAVAGLQPKR